MQTIYSTQQSFDRPLHYTMHKYRKQIIDSLADQLVGRLGRSMFDLKFALLLPGFRAAKHIHGR